MDGSDLGGRENKPKKAFIANRTDQATEAFVALERIKNRKMEEVELEQVAKGILKQEGAISSECSRASSVETLKADSSQDLEELASQKSPEVLIEEAEVLPIESEAKTEGDTETKNNEAKEESPKNIKKLFKNLIPEGEKSKSEPTSPKSPTSPPFQSPTDAVSPEEVESLFK